MDSPGPDPDPDPDAEAEAKAGVVVKIELATEGQQFMVKGRTAVVTTSNDEEGTEVGLTLGCDEGMPDGCLLGRPVGAV